MSKAEKKMRFSFKSFDRKILDNVIQNLLGFLKKSGIEYSHPIPLPKKINRETVLTSPHVNKDAREQFERITYKVFLDVSIANQEFLVKYLEDFEIPAGIGVNVKMI